MIITIIRMIIIIVYEYYDHKNDDHDDRTTGQQSLCAKLAIVLTLASALWRSFHQVSSLPNSITTIIITAIIIFNIIITTIIFTITIITISKVSTSQCALVPTASKAFAASSNMSRQISQVPYHILYHVLS